MDHSIYELIALILGPGGAVYLGVKGSLNGIKKDVRDIRDWTLKQGDS